jgi:hypothetical protein
MRKQPDPIKLASDIGAKAYDLLQMGDIVARMALAEIADVNPAVMHWLYHRLKDTVQPMCEDCPFPEGKDRGEFLPS